MNMKTLKMQLILYFMLAITMGCGNSKNEDAFVYLDNDKEVILPSDLSLSIIVVGADTENPDGNGSGEVQLKAVAENAVKYIFNLENVEEEQISMDGTLTHIFTESGIKDYEIKVSAYSETGQMISISETVRILVHERELQLVWSDEFDTEGAVSLDNWKFETLGPDNGSWWNGELQHYTDRTDNAFVSDGTLKIVAKRETYISQGVTKEFTSARLTSLFTFTYGRVDVRAKLPYGKGTWPAIWMVGSNIDTVGWPACGEIDIMEHWGHEPGKITSATHTPSCSGGCPQVSVGNTTITDYDTEFHVYSVEWTEDALRFLIDGEFVYDYKPHIKDSDTWPFTADQFIILNVAMGGSWFEVDPDFVSSNMEIDYVRVYQ